MTAAALLDELRTKRVQLTVDGERLGVDAPRGALTDALRQAIRQHKAALLTLLAQPAPANDTAATVPSAPQACPEPLAPFSSCAVCSGTERWNDDGVWRCRACWPEPVTHAARQAEALEQSRAQTPTRTRGHSKPRDPQLGPILPFCGCGDHRYWHDHTTDAWHCWTCVPPRLASAAREA
jgi:hypothetical protein